MLSIPHKSENLAFSNSSGLKNVFEKLHFHDGLVWTAGLAIEIKLNFQIGDLLVKFSRQIIFSLAMATKTVAAWSAVRADIGHMLGNHF